MNERIRELQSKSYLMCKQIVDDDGHVVVTPDKWFDKFTELLVRECITKAEQEEDRFFEMGEVDLAYAMKNFQNLLKQDFGVE